MGEQIPIGFLYGSFCCECDEMQMNKIKIQPGSGSFHLLLRYTLELFLPDNTLVFTCSVPQGIVQDPNIYTL